MSCLEAPSLPNGNDGSYQDAGSESEAITPPEALLSWAAPSAAAFMKQIEEQSSDCQSPTPSLEIAACTDEDPDSEWEGGEIAGCIDLDDALDWAEVGSWASNTDKSIAIPRVGTACELDRSTGAIPVVHKCIRCGEEVETTSDMARPFFFCGVLDRPCQEVATLPDREVYLHCCSICGESRILSVYLDEVDFVCGLAGYACVDGLDLATESDMCDGSDGRSSGSPVSSLQHCCVCGATYAMQIDLQNVGIDFQCTLVGRQCWESVQELRREGGAELAVGSMQQKAVILSLIEQQRLLGKLDHSRHQKRLGRTEVARNLQQQASEIKERYRDSAVVCTRGERFVSLVKKASPGPQAQIAGIIGAGSRGRLGLGLKKMSKEEAEKMSLSNRQRGHIKKRVAHAKNERETIVFETRKNVHKLTNAAILPSSVIR